MEKVMGKLRTIRFHSEKNGEVLTVHTMAAKKFAEALEKDKRVKRYETNVGLENWVQRISTAGIRKTYLSVEWTSDFLIVTEDERVSIREIAGAETFCRRAELEKLEISRRYWKTAHVEDWKVIRMEGEAW